MWQDLLLKAEEQLKLSDYEPRPPATHKEIEETKSQARARLNVDLPESYLGFLRFRNGFGFEGLLIYSALTPLAKDPASPHYYRDIIDANEVWRDYEPHKDYLFFAESDTSLYCLNLLAARYEEQDRDSATVIQVYPDFDLMLADAIRQQALPAPE